MSFKTTTKPVAQTTQKGKDMITVHGKQEIEDVKLSEHFSLFELCKTKKQTARIGK